MWGQVASMVGGGLVGGIIGGTSSPGYKGQKFEQMLADADRRKYGQSGAKRLEGWASGQKPLMKQADINRLLSGQMGRLDATAKEARTRATERSVGRGEGAHSGAKEASLANIDRALLDAKRQQGSAIHGQLAAQTPAFQLQAQNAQDRNLWNQEQMAYAEHGRLEELAAAREAAGPAWHRALAGMTSGMGQGGQLYNMFTG